MILLILQLANNFLGNRIEARECNGSPFRDRYMASVEKWPCSRCFMCGGVQYGEV